MNNDELDLVKILKDVPKGTKFYCTPYGDVKFNGVTEDEDIDYPISFIGTTKNGDECVLEVTPKGTIYENFNGECVFFPSRDNRDWSTFEYVPRPKHEFKTFDRILVREDDGVWRPAFFSIREDDCCITMEGLRYYDDECIPYEGNEILAFTTNMPKGGEE